MTDYIKREEAMEIVKRTSGDYASAFAELRKLPAAGVAPVRRGQWVLNKKYGDYECSECGQENVLLLHFMRLKMRYCPNCGAAMHAPWSGGTR